jgi:hypothetical protein
MECNGLVFLGNYLPVFDDRMYRSQLLKKINTMIQDKLKVSVKLDLHFLNSLLIQIISKKHKNIKKEVI